MTFNLWWFNLICGGFNLICGGFNLICGGFNLICCGDVSSGVGTAAFIASMSLSPDKIIMVLRW